MLTGMGNPDRISSDLFGIDHFAHGVSLEFEMVGVVDETVEDGVGDGVVGDDFVPDGQGELAGDDVGLALAGFEELEYGAVLALFDEGEAPVVDEEQVETGEFAQVFAELAAELGGVEVAKERGGLY